MRVMRWAERLLLSNPVPNPDAVRLAAAFHDVGYARGLKEHARHSADILREYAAVHPIHEERLNRALFLVAEHSDKTRWMNDAHAPEDLVLLMEADLLDEEGALGLARDFLTVGAAGGGYLEAYARMMRYEPSRVAKNPMVTEAAKQIWEEKQNLLRQFIRQLSFDLGFEIDKTQ